MPHEVPGNGPQARFGGQQVHFLLKFVHHLIGLVGVEVCRLDGVQDLVSDLRVFDLLDLLSAVLIIQRHGGLVIHGALEVIHGDIAAEGTGGQLVGREQRSAGETDARSRGQ